MGRAARWLRGLLGGGKKPGSGDSERKPASEKKRWGFGKSFREKEKRGTHHHGAEPPRPPRRAVERKGSCRESAWPYASGEDDDDDGQSRRAIAVAAATAAVAEAAVAAAQAAAAVVRLTSSGRCVAGGFRGGAKREEWAAVKIQSAFRGYLARRARKALRGLVKLQALVRGSIVRKQAAETLRCMHALARVQARAQACRTLHSDHRNQPGPQTPEKYEQIDRTNRPKSNRNSLKSSRAIGGERSLSSSGRNSWLDRWMEEKYCHGRNGALDDDRSAKILEVDPGKPKMDNSKSRGGHLHSSCSTLTSDQNSRSFTTVQDSPSKDPPTAQMSVPSPSSVDVDQGKVADVGESPQFYSARHGSSRRSFFTPSNSECSRSLFGGYSDYPNYMANTESSRAKVRSQSAPKQRPEHEKTSSIRRPLGHSFGQPPPLPMPSAQRSTSLQAKFANKVYPGSGGLDRSGMPVRY